MAQQPSHSSLHGLSSVALNGQSRPCIASVLMALDTVHPLAENAPSVHNSYLKQDYHLFVRTNELRGRLSPLEQVYKI